MYIFAKSQDSVHITCTQIKTVCRLVQAETKLLSCYLSPGSNSWSNWQRDSGWSSAIHFKLDVEYYPTVSGITVNLSY